MDRPTAALTERKIRLLAAIANLSAFETARSTGGHKGENNTRAWWRSVAALKPFVCRLAFYSVAVLTFSSFRFAPSSAAAKSSDVLNLHAKRAAVKACIEANGLMERLMMFC